MDDLGPATPQIRWLAVQNVSTLPVPPYGLVRITGVTTDGLITVGQPDADSQSGLLINGPVAIPPQQNGSCHQTFPCPAAYSLEADSTVLPVTGAEWGSAAGSWYLQSDQDGYIIVGGGDGVGITNVLGPDSGTDVTTWVVTDVQCVGGQLQVTKQCVRVPLSNNCPSGSGSGSGSGGGNCCTGNCGTPGVPATLTVTFTDKAGCFTTLPDTLTLDCTTHSTVHDWESSTFSVCGLDGVQAIIACVSPTFAPAFALANGSIPPLPPTTQPQDGWTCSPFFAVYLVDNGAGGTFTATVTE